MNLMTITAEQPVTQNSIPNIAVVYACALLQGMTLVSFPASSAVLKQMHGFSDAQYGSIFLPQVALAVIGAVGGGTLARGLGLKTLLWLALLANAISQGLLALSTGFDSLSAYTCVLMGTAALGLGFGLSGAPLNAYPPILFPNKKSTAIVALHTTLGVGLMIGPLMASVFADSGRWVGFPIVLFVISLLLTLAGAVVKLPRNSVTSTMETGRDAPYHSSVFWLFATIAVFYAFAEGTFSNWAVIYLHEAKKLPQTVSALSLSVFWGALVLGRLLISMLLLRIAAEIFWRLLPPLMIAAFLLLPYANTAALGLGLFAFAGLACSAFFPLTIALASKYFESHVAWVSSMLTAALMLGIGAGSFLIGSLRSLLGLETLYQVSAFHPFLVLLLVLIVSSSRKTGKA